MRKQGVWIGTLFAMLVLLMLSVASFPVRADAPPTPTPSALRAKGVPVLPPIGKSVEVSGRLQLLNRKLGISMDQLKRMSSEQILNLFEQNADRLEMTVSRRVQGKDGKAEWITFGSKPPSIIPTPVPNPKPAPSGTLPRLSQSPQTTWRVFLPLVVKPTGAPDPVALDIIVRLDKARFYIDKLYQESSYPERGFMKEYPGCPVGIINQTQFDWTNPRFAGHYYVNATQTFGKVYWFGVGTDYDIQNVTFEANYNWGWVEPDITCDRYYGAAWTGVAGGVFYEVSKWQWSGDTTDRVDVTLGDWTAITDVRTKPNGTTTQVNLGVEGRLPSHRFTIRHATQMGRLFYTAYMDWGKYNKMFWLIDEYGFDPDIYMPMFWSSYDYADDFMFQYPAYHDCDLTNRGVESTIPFWHFPHRYPYESKVCLGRDAYIALSRLDYLSPTLQAIHIMLKYSNADYVYPHPRGWGTTTPRQMAREIETNGWNGYGIKAYLKDPTYASGVRTNAFLAMESMLGYLFGDTTSQGYADNTVAVLRQVQWGMPPFAPYQGKTADDGVITRPNHTGGALLAWRPGGSYQYDLPPRTFLTDVMDWLGMPKEVEGPIPSNAETTLTYWQALRVYLFYKYGIWYPGGGE